MKKTETAKNAVASALLNIQISHGLSDQEMTAILAAELQDYAKQMQRAAEQPQKPKAEYFNLRENQHEHTER